MRLNLTYLFLLLAVSQMSAQVGTSIQSTYTSSAIEDPSDLINCSNGDVVVTGTLANVLNTSGIAFRTDPLGNLIWSRSYDFNQDLSIEKGIETLDGGLCFLGSYGDVGAHDSNSIVLVKTDATGQLQFSRRIHGALSPFIEATDFFQGTDSCYYVCGYTYNVAGGFYNPLVFKTDPTGNVIWIKGFSNGNTKATTMAFNNADRMAIGILDVAAGDVQIVEVDTAGTITNAIVVIQSPGSPIVSISTSVYGSASMSYQFGVNSFVPYWNFTNWTIDVSSSFQFQGGTPIHRNGDSLHLVEILPITSYKNVFLLESPAGFSRTLIQDPGASIFGIGSFIDTLTQTYPVSFKYMDHHAMMVLTEIIDINGIVDGFMLTRTLDTFGLYPDIPIDGCHMKYSGSVAGMGGFSSNTLSVTQTNFLLQTTTSTIAVTASNYTLIVGSNCYMVDVPFQSKSEIGVSTLHRPGDYFTATNLPAGATLYVYEMQGKIVYSNLNYSNDLQSSTLSPCMYVYEFILPDNSIVRGKFIVVP